MRRTKQVIAIVAVAAIIFADLSPALAAATPAATVTANASASQLPPFPEDASRPAPDYAAIDWERDVTLERDREDYFEQFKKLRADGKMAGAAALRPASRKMWDDEVLAEYHVPETVAAAVKQYRSDMSQTTDATARAVLTAGLQQKLSALRTDQGSPQAGDLLPDQNFITTDKAQIVPADKLHPVGVPTAPRVLDERLLPYPAEGRNPVWDLLNNRRPLPKNNILSRLWGSVLASLGTPVANATNHTPIIAYYNGIENRAMDYALYNVAQQQNTDGSFGATGGDRYILSGDLGVLLSQFQRTANDQYPLLTNYLQTTTTADNREHALKIILLAAFNQPYQTLLSQVQSTMNANGGFGLDAGYNSDVLSTIYVLHALENTQQSVVPPLYYLLSQIASDGTMRVTAGGDPSYYLMYKTAEALVPYRGYTVVDPGNPANNLDVNTKVNALLSYLQSSYDSATGSLLGTNDTIDYAMTLRSLELYSVATSTATALYTRILSEQNPDGSFGTSLRATLEVMNAIARPDFVVESIVPQGQLVSRTAATINVTVRNIGYRPAVPGDVAVMLDNYHDAGLTFQCTNNLLPTQGTLVIVQNIQTDSWIGDTALTMYVEHPRESNFDNNWLKQTVAVAPAADGTPAVPAYHIAHSEPQNGQPGINIRWPVKNDPNRLRYSLFFREQGTSTWYDSAIPNNTSGAIATPFIEGVTYEVAAGVMHLDGVTITYRLDTTIVITAGNPALNTGSVAGRATEHNVASPNLFLNGFTISTTTDSVGNFGIARVPNGSNVLRAWLPEYDEFAERFTVLPGNSATGIRVFTKLKADTAPPAVGSLTINQNLPVKNQRTQSVVIGAGDNVGVKEGDLYYFNPQSSSWIYLATIDFQHQTSAAYDWYVPAELSGQGYKLRAVVRDYQNNESAPFETAPFAILDGTLPAGTITVENLTGNSWALGEQKRITWTVSSTSPIQSFGSLTIEHGSSADTVWSGVPLSARDYTYTLPFRSNYIAPDAAVLLNVCDTNNNCADLTSAPFAIIDNTPAPPPPWTMPAPQSFVTTTYGLERYLAYADTETNGDMEIVYREFIGQSWEQPNGQLRRLVYRRLSGAVWQAPVIVKEYQYRSFQAGDRNLYFQDIHTASSGAGDIHIVYQEYVSGGLTEMDQNEIRYLHVALGQLVSDQQISNDATDSSNPDLAVSLAGVVSIAWNEGYSWTTQSGTNFIRYREGNGLNSWSPTETISTMESGQPQVVLDGADAAAVFYADAQPYLTRRVGGNWSVPLVVHRPEIPRAKLDQFTADAARLQYIVTADPADQSLYRWLPNIRTRNELQQVLLNNSFVNESAIINEWYSSQYGYNARVNDLFFVGADNYDLFYKQATADTNWRNDLFHLRFSANIASGASQTVFRYSPADRATSDSVVSARIVSPQSGQYHILLVKEEQEGTYTPSRLHHVYLDGERDYYRALVSRRSMYVDANNVVVSHRGHDLDVYYTSGYAGASTVFHSHADYGPIINYRIRSMMPQTSGLGSTVLLDWTTTGGPIDSYEVRFGLSRTALNTLVTGLVPDEYTVTGLAPNNTYYWQIIGMYQGIQIPSNIFGITTGNYVVVPTSFRSISLSKPSIFADTRDTQTATLVVNTSNPGALSQANIIVNYPGQSTNPPRGYFHWDPTNGFQALGGANYGAQFVRFLPPNAASSTLGSERIIDTANNTVTFKFRWTANPGYGNISDNAIWYHFAETTGFTNPWTRATQTFATREAEAVVLLDKPTIDANGTDLQTATYYIRRPDITKVDEVNLIVNYPWPGQTNPARGYFQWKPTTGFQTLGGSNYGREHINLKPINPTQPLVGSEISIDTVNNLAILKFRWSANPSYGTMATNTLSYHFAERTTPYVHFWKLIPETFNVNAGGYLPASLNALTVSSTYIHNNGQDIQSADIVINTSDPNTLVDDVRMIVNYPNTSPNNAGGYFQWTRTGGWQKLGADYYGNHKVNLLPPNPANPLLGSEVIADTANRVLRVRFRWTANPNYGAVPDNDISVWFKESSTGHTVQWAKVETNFGVGL